MQGLLVPRVGLGTYVRGHDMHNDRVRRFPYLFCPIGPLLCSPSHSSYKAPPLFTRRVNTRTKMFIRSSPKKNMSVAFLLFNLSAITLAFSFHVIHQQSRPPRAKSGIYMSTIAFNGSAPTILSTMKKMSKVMSVGLEYSGQDLSSTEISILSMQLRKCKVSAIFSQDINDIKGFATEQQSALGNFPGPCPVIFNGPASEAKAAFEAGASAVVLPASAIERTASFDGEVIWRVETSQDIDSVLETTAGKADVFLLDVTEEALPTVVEKIPMKALWIAAVDAMLADGKEINIAKQCKTLGCGSIMVRKACVGDSEDLEYAQFCVGGVTSKASSEFKFSGLTGSTNGHFGGIQSNSSIKWRRPSF